MEAVCFKYQVRQSIHHRQVAKVMPWDDQPTQYWFIPGQTLQTFLWNEKKACNVKHFLSETMKDNKNRSTFT